MPKTPITVGDKVRIVADFGDYYAKDDVLTVRAVHRFVLDDGHAGRSYLLSGGCWVGEAHLERADAEPASAPLADKVDEIARAVAILIEVGHSAHNYSQGLEMRLKDVDARLQKLEPPGSAPLAVTRGLYRTRDGSTAHVQVSAQGVWHGYIDRLKTIKAEEHRYCRGAWGEDGVECSGSAAYDLVERIGDLS